MRVIVYPYPGQTFLQPLPNDWHTPGFALKIELVTEGFEVYGEHETTAYPDEDIAIYFDALLRESHPPMHKKSIYICQEPPVIYPRFYDRIKGWPYTRILTFSRKHCGGNIRYLPYPVPDYKYVQQGSGKRQDLVAIAANKWSNHPDQLYGVRNNLYYALGSQLDLYGHGWESEPTMLSRVNYKGACKSNYETYLNYKTAISIENQYLEGYASEKYWTPLQAGCKLMRIGWEPDYGFADCSDYGWAEQVAKHVKEVAK